MITPSDLTHDMVRSMREAKRISRDDFESWTYDSEAARRVCAAVNNYYRQTWLSSIDDPTGATP